MVTSFEIDRSESPSPELAATVLMSGDEPSFEEFTALQTRREALETLRHNALSGQSEIADMQIAIEDENNPPSIDDMERFQERTQKIVEDLDAGLSNEKTLKSDSDLQTATVERVQQISVPEL